MTASTPAPGGDTRTPNRAGAPAGDSVPLGLDEQDRPDGPAGADDPSSLALARARGLPEAEREQVIADVVVATQRLAARVAHRYAGRGEPFEDVLQVAVLGLLLAARRFDPDRGVGFTAFAVPTIEGEVKRHFRDHVWAVRPPRRLQELRPAVVDVQDRLEQQLGRRPTPEEIAEVTGATPEEVTETLALGTAYRSLSLEGLDLAAGGVAEVLAAPDARLVEVENRLAVRPALECLPDRTRQVLRLHYLEEHSQQRVADEVGLSQVQVSRIVRAAIADLQRTVARDASPVRAG